MGADQNLDEEFTPKGAVAFFIVLLLFFIIVYFSIYFQMLSWG